MQSKSVDWFPHDRDLRHEKVNRVLNTSLNGATRLLKIPLTHLFLMHPFFAPREHQIISLFCCFQGVEKGCIEK